MQHQVLLHEFTVSVTLWFLLQSKEARTVVRLFYGAFPSSVFDLIARLRYL